MDRENKAKKYPTIATVLWLVYFCLLFFLTALNAKNENKEFMDYIMPGTIYLMVLVLAIAAATFMEKKVVLAVAVGLFSLNFFYDFIGIKKTIEFSSYYYVKDRGFDIYSFLQFVSVFALFILLVLAVFKRKLPTWVWLIPGVVWFVYELISLRELLLMNKTWWEPFSYKIVTVDCVIWTICAAALVFMGLWLKNSTQASSALSETVVDESGPKTAKDKKIAIMILGGCASMYAAIVYAMVVYCIIARDSVEMNSYLSAFQRQSGEVVPFNTFFFKNFFTSRSSFGYLFCVGAALTVAGIIQKKDAAGDAPKEKTSIEMAPEGPDTEEDEEEE